MAKLGRERDALDAVCGELVEFRRLIAAGDHLLTPPLRATRPRTRSRLASCPKGTICATTHERTTGPTGWAERLAPSIQRTVRKHALALLGPWS